MCCMMVSLVVGVGAAVALPFYLKRKKEKQIEDILATGKQGEATILSLEDTGVLVNYNPQVTLLLEIRVPGYSPYQVRKTAVVPLVRLSQLQVGAVLPAYADPSQPQNPDKVALILK